MTNLVYLKQGHLDDLRHHINANINYYRQPDPWLDSFFKEGGWYLPSKIPFGDVELISPKSATEHYDFENTKIIYDALKGLSLTQASDERLWASLCHTTFWKYMRSRWPVEDWADKPRVNELIKERYFLIPNRSRGLIRNGIARLWWYGYVSYDEKRTDPYELTRVLLKTLDISESLLGRAFSHNRNIAKTILSSMAKLETLGKPFYHRESFRDLMKYINQVGGVTILDALDPSDLESLLDAKIKKIPIYST